MSADTTVRPVASIAAQLAAFAHGLEPGMVKLFASQLVERSPI
jgi:hypothetical protein